MPGYKRSYDAMTKYTPKDKVYKQKKYTKYTKHSTSDHKLLMALKKNVYQHEKKFIDQDLAAGALYALAGTATITLLNNIQQGVDETNRIGRQINMKSIFLRGEVHVANTTVGQGAIRTIIVIDQEVPQSTGSGVVMAITDFLNVDALYSPNNLNNRKRFKVLMDEVMPLSGCTVSTGNPNTQIMNRYIKLNTTVEFNSNNAGTIADFTKNAVYLITYSSGLSVTAPVSNLWVRTRFTDN